MKLDIDFKKIPKYLTVNVQKGESGALIAEVSDLGVTTEANDLNELFINVNDLIYTYFDIPKKYQDQIQFIPNITARMELVKTASEEYKKDKSEDVKLNTYYTQDLCKRIMSA